MKKIAVIGSGSWGIALSVHLAKLGNNIKVWSFNKEEADFINNNRKCKFLPNLELPENIVAYTEYKDVIIDTDLILHVTPSKFTRENVQKYKKYVTNQPIVLCSKGFEAGTLYTLSDVVKEELPNSIVAALSGPSHAEEVSIDMPTAVVVASENKEVLQDLQKIFMSENLRVYTTEDLKGVELGGALKNIIAFCAGVIAGLGYGDNTFAALITRGLVEITRLGTKIGGKQETFHGLTCLGDLIVTCLSQHSRNRRAGFLIGQGKTIDQAKQEIGMTIESIDNIEIAYKLSKKYDVDMPIVNAVYDVLFNNAKVEDAVKKLMTREPKSE